MEVQLLTARTVGGGTLWLLLWFDNMTHKDGVAGIGDDEEEEWVIHVESWWATVQDVFTASCSRNLSPFFVYLQHKIRRCLQRIQSPSGYHWFPMYDVLQMACGLYRNKVKD